MITCPIKLLLALFIIIINLENIAKIENHATHPAYCATQNGTDGHEEIIQEIRVHGSNQSLIKHHTILKDHNLFDCKAIHRYRLEEKHNTILY